MITYWSLLFDTFLYFEKRVFNSEYNKVLDNKLTGVCVACNVALTIKHILIECVDLLETRKKYFEEKSLYSLSRNVIPEVAFDFLREIGVFYKI